MRCRQSHREIFIPTGRFVDLQDIPAELLSRVDVARSPAAADITCGIAGVVDVRLHRPCDFSGTCYTAYGRSREVTGPFVGRDGGCGVFRDGDREYIVYHACDAWHHGIPTLRIAPLSWSSDGWPTADTD